MKIFLRYLFPVIALGLLVFTWSVSIGGNGGWSATFSPATSAGLLYNLMRLAGLTAFSLVAFQILTGPYMKLWEKLYGPKFYRFHAYQGILAFALACLHPVLVYSFAIVSHLGILGISKNYPFTYWFGPLAWLLMLITVSTAVYTILMRRGKFSRSWHWLHLLNYLVFVLVFVHSLTIGSDVSPAMSQLRLLWWLYFVGMLVGFFYRRVLRMIQEKQSGLDS